MYQGLENYELAVDYFKESLEIDLNLGNKEYIAHSYNNLGELYLDYKKDNRIGISKENQKRLFRIDSDFKIKGIANESGTGLGLILCDELIRQNGGEISVKSEEGKGSIFTFTLPIVNSDG